MKPIRIYLDTSDYARFYKQESGIMDVYNFLIRKKEEGSIEIGFSYPIVWELIQEYEADYRQDRINRAKCIHDLCGSNAYLFLYNINKNGGDAFSRTGWWYAADEHFIDIEDLTLELLKMLSLSRNERRVLKTSQGRKRFFNDKPRLTDFSILPQAKLLFTDEFMSRDIFRKYLLGKIDRNTANRYLSRSLSELDTFLIRWFEGAGKDNPMGKICGKEVWDKIKEDLEKMRQYYPLLKKAISKQKKVEKSLRKAAANSNKLLNEHPPSLSDTFRKTNLIVNLIKDASRTRKNLTNSASMKFMDKNKDGTLESRVGGFIFEIIKAYMIGNVTVHQERKISDSDIGDMLHACYLPYCDLWRGDTNFSHLLITSDISYKDKIVPNLQNIPIRINALLD